ncbi:MAG: response regulator [Oligoflexia bacterium]|nr:response regulator [Oligoflexia bacterium]MBF0367757.1 response regulator [Oligoflexia bacterium]
MKDLTYGFNDYMILDNLPRAVAIHKVEFDQNNEPCNYTYTYVNQQFCEVLNKSKEEVVGHKVTELFPGIEKDSADWIKIYGRIAAQGGHEDTIQYSEHLDRWYRVMYFGLPNNMFFVMFDDITEEKRKESSLSKALASSVDAVFILKALYNHRRDIRDFEIIYVNPAAEKQIQTPKEALIGHKINELYFTKSGKISFYRCKEAFIKQLPCEEEYEVISEHLAPGHYYQQTIPTESGVVIFCRDITERKKQEKQAYTTGKLITLGSITAGITHEITNPLQVIQSCMEVLNDKYGNNDSLTRELIERTLVASSKIFGLVSSLKVLYRRPTKLGKSSLGSVINGPVFGASNDGTSDIISVKDLVHGMTPLVSPILKGDIEFNINYQHLPEEIFTNAPLAATHQILISLLSNASEAIKESASPEQGKISITVDERKHFIDFIISDNGPGMLPEIQHKIFEPFFSTRLERGSAGLGLAISEKLAHEMNGELRLLNTNADGTTFVFSLPRVYPSEHFLSAQKELQNKRGKEWQRPTANNRILVVDDEKDFCLFFSRILIVLGFNVTTASSGEEGRTLFSKEHFDYVIVDSNMPKITGERMIELILKDHPETKCKFFITSGRIDLEDVSYLPPQIRARVGAIIPKPFSIDLIKRILI